MYEIDSAMRRILNATVPRRPATLLAVLGIAGAVGLWSGCGDDGGDSKDQQVTDALASADHAIEDADQAIENTDRAIHRARGVEGASDADFAEADQAIEDADREI